MVGPESAGSYPGPACYRNNGPITLTDCNLVLGRIIGDDFPKFFSNEASRFPNFMLFKVSPGKFKSSLISFNYLY